MILKYCQGFKIMEPHCIYMTVLRPNDACILFSPQTRACYPLGTSFPRSDGDKAGKGNKPSNGAVVYLENSTYPILQSAVFPYSLTGDSH